mgnify:FL=1
MILRKSGVINARDYWVDPNNEYAIWFRGRNIENDRYGWIFGLVENLGEHFTQGSTCGCFLTTR